MRRASFRHTQEQMRVGAAAARASADGYAGFVPGGKDITRRVNWRWAQAGMFLLAVEKTQGIRRGDLVETFGVVELLSVTREPLNHIALRARGPIGDVEREGFPGMTGREFVRMFCEHMPGARADVEVARVVLRHVDVRRIASALLALTDKQAAELGVQMQRATALAERAA